MAVIDIYNDLYPQIAFDTQLIDSDTTTAGNIIDTAGYTSGILLSLFSGVVTAGDITPLIEEGDASNLSDATAVEDRKIVPVNIGGTWYYTGQEAASKIDASNTIRDIGLVGTKRFIRVSFVSDNSADLTAGAIVHKEGDVQSVYGS